MDSLIGAIIEKLLVNPERPVDANGYPRIHLITNGFFVTPEALDSLEPRTDYLGFTLSVDSYHHNGSDQMHGCKTVSPEEIWSEGHMQRCPYFERLVGVTKMMMQFNPNAPLLVNVEESRIVETAVNKRALAS